MKEKNDLIQRVIDLLKEENGVLKTKEQELKTKENEFKTKENEFKTKENEFKTKENELKTKEKELKTKEKEFEITRLNSKLQGALRENKTLKRVLQGKRVHRISSIPWRWNSSVKRLFRPPSALSTFSFTRKFFRPNKLGGFQK
ncbi:hypothetical protein TNCV_4452501 [Trichonephila clavipes]|nr:hypothetical protein TNCV_4452501 [Trichonephila clavipes]